MATVAVVVAVPFPYLRTQAAAWAAVAASLAAAEEVPVAEETPADINQKQHHLL